MRSSKKRSLSNQDARTLAVVCGSFAFLVALAVWIAPNSDIFISQAPTHLTAATDLGVDQGIPAYNRASPFQRISTPGDPMPVWCYSYNLSERARNNQNLPGCNESGFNISVFSASKKGTSVGQSQVWAVIGGYDLYAPQVIAEDTPPGSCGWVTRRQGGRDNATYEPVYVPCPVVPAPNYTTRKVGSQLSVPLGSTITLAWACQPQQVLTKTRCDTAVVHTCLNTVEDTWQVKLYGSVSKSFSAGGTGYYGSTDIKPTAAGTYTYTLTCNPAANSRVVAKTSTLSVVVTPRPPAPTVTITADSRSLTVGQSTVVRATFAAGAGDTLLKTAINNSSNALVPGLSWTPPTNKNWTFKPTAPGTFIFAPAVQTQTYPAWDDYNKSVSITVSCPSGQINQGGACTATPCPTGQHRVNGACIPITCPTGQHLVGNSCVPTTCPTGQHLVGNSCVPITCPTGQHLVGNSCVPTTCPTGQHLVGNSCVPITCPTGQHLVGNSCVPNVVDACLNMPGVQTGVPAHCTQQALPSGGADCVPISSAYIISGASCVPRGVINTFTVNPTRVRARETVTLSWNVSNMTSCGITTTNGVVVTANSAANGSNGSHSVPTTLSKVTRYVLSCADTSATYTREVEADIIPVVQEI